MINSPRKCLDCGEPTNRDPIKASRCLPCATERRRVQKAAKYQVARLRTVECSLDGCRRSGRLTGGLCGTHYDRLIRTGSTADPVFLGPVERRRRRNEARARHRRANAEQVAAYNRAYYAANRARESTRNRSWRCANPQREAARSAGWRVRNPLKCRQMWAAKNARRYARVVATRIGPVDYDAILRDFGMVCHLCGGRIESGLDLHFDHVIPLAKGGPHVTGNIRPSHARCNQRKGARLDAAADRTDVYVAAQGAERSALDV